MIRRHGVTAVTAAVLASTIALALLAWSAEPRHASGVAPSLALAVLLAWSGVLQVHVRHRGATEAFDLFDVVLVVCATAFAAPVLVPLAVLAKASSQLVQRVELRKAAFNSVTAGACAAAMALVLQATPGAPLLAALALASLAGWAVNHVALVAVLAVVGLLQEVARAAAVRRWAVQGLVSGALGLLLALSWVQSPFAVLLFVVPLAALHSAGRSLARAAAERRRLAGTAAASRVLSSGTTADLPAYLEQLQAAFGAQAAFLRIGAEQQPPILVGGGVPEPVRGWLAGLDGVLPAEQAQRFHLELPETVEVLAARVPGEAAGVLAVVDPRGERGSGSAELATTMAAAREVAAFLAAQQARAVATQEHERLEVVIRSVADGIVTVSAQGTLLSFNSAAADITGLAPEDALGSSACTLALSTPDGLPWEPALDVRVQGVRLQLRTAAGMLKHVDVSSSPAIVDGQDCAVLVLRDVTARVEQERARQQFVIGLGHELRTPLTPLLGWARTLRRRPELLDGSQRALMVDALDTESARLARLVDNLLTAVDPTSLVSPRTSVNLVELVRAQLRRARPQLAGRTVTVVAAGDVEVTTNPRAVSLILDNVLSNVARYTPAGTPLQVQVSAAAGAAVVEVLDSGPGVPETQREEIFGLFVRGNGDAANPGVGMGLAVSRSLARSLGGDLQCTPPPGGDDETAGAGACFRLVLPVHVRPRSPGVAVTTQLFGT